MTRAFAALALAAAFAAAARADVEPRSDSFDYLYIRAHEGTASGGHAAVRFGDEIFDFQHDGGFVTPRRDDSRRFQHAYRTLENRSIELSRIAATPETVALLRGAFERRWIVELRQIEWQRELQRDVALLAAFAAGREARVPVRGAGFFAVANEPGAAPPALAELRERIAQRHGTAWLAERRAEALRALRSPSLAPVAMPALPLDPQRYPVGGDPLSRRASWALAAIAAVDALETPHTLREDACVRAAPASTGFSVDEQARLQTARAALLDAAAALAASRRPDWGEALLLASARLAAIDASLASGQLAMLDALPRDATLLPMTERRRALAPALLAEANRDLALARDGFFAGSGFREASWTELEAAVSRVAALRAAEAGAPMLRVAPGTLLPEGFADVAVPHPAVDREDIARALEVAHRAEAAQRGALGSQYGYDLIRRNCVSELFRTIDAALASRADAPLPDAAATRAFVTAESQRRLGGYVDPVARGNFIPFVSSRHVRDQWDVVRRMHLPSLREYTIAREGTLGAALRESNVLTSSLDADADGAGSFLFFTDGSWPLRPLLGAANLGVALARSGVGVLQLPFDRGRGLRDGLEGALWSLPELFFANIRKGTSDYVAPALRPPVE